MGYNRKGGVRAKPRSPLPPIGPSPSPIDEFELGGQQQEGGRQGREADVA